MPYLMPDGLIKIIATDFDGVLCEEKWPDIGKENKQIIEYLISEKEKGAYIILWTLRCGARLDEAIVWCKERGLTFDAVNQNMPEPIAKYRSESRKIFAHEYIDDRNNTMFPLPYITNNKHIYGMTIEAEVEFINSDGDTVKILKTYEDEDENLNTLKDRITTKMVQETKKLCPSGGQVHIMLTMTKNGEWLDSDEDYIDISENTD